MTVQTTLPRGIRNNNPLNIRLNRDSRWQGRVPPKHNSDGAFEQFHDPMGRVISIHRGSLISFRRLDGTLASRLCAR